MKLLQGFHISVAMVFHIFNTMGGCQSGSNGGHIGNLRFDGCFAKIAVVMYAFLTDGAVDHKLDFAVGNEIDQCVGCRECRYSQKAADRQAVWE